MLGCQNETNSEENKVVELSSEQQLLNAIEHSQQLWADSHLQDYQYRYQNTPIDCPQADAMPAVIVQVENNEVVRVLTAEGSQEQDKSAYSTLDVHFTTLKTLIAAAPMTLAASEQQLSTLPQFDALYGYSLGYYVDQSNAECDAYAIRISDFQ